VTATSEDRTSTAPGAPDERPAQWAHDHRPGRFGWIFAAVWLFYLLQPLSDAWTSRAPAPWRILAVIALLAFAAGFIVFFAQWRSRRTAGRVRRPGVVWLALGLGMVLLALAAAGAGESTLGGFVYLGVTAAMTLPVQRSLAVVAVLVALSVGLPRVVPGWTPQDDFIPSLVLACFAAYGISQIIERNAELARAREQLVDLAVSRERERMGRDVHDILGHSLTVITVKTELAGRLLEDVPPGPAVDRARAEVADAERLAREALADVRATVSGMRQLSLTGELAAARQALDAAGIAADLPSAVDDVPARYRELFAFALREGVTNVVRHSGARRCVVRLTADCIEVRDDGRGPGGTDGGSGLSGLRGRAVGAGARLEAGQAAEGGFLLRVTPT
jgi:two-component system sensor histidine kinase DesK